MGTTVQFSITLPQEMAEQLRAKVRAGEYANESEVVRDGLRALAVRDQAVHDWLLGQVAPAYDRLRAEPGRALSPSQLRARLARLHTEQQDSAQDDAVRPRTA